MIRFRLPFYGFAPAISRPFAAAKRIQDVAAAGEVDARGFIFVVDLAHSSVERGTSTSKVKPRVGRLNGHPQQSPICIASSTSAGSLLAYQFGPSTRLPCRFRS